MTQRAAVDLRPALGPKAVSLSFVQIELKATATPPAPVPELVVVPAPVIPEKADVALEKAPEKSLVEPQPSPSEAQVAQVAASQSTEVASVEPLAGNVKAAVDWRASAIAKVRAMVEHEKYYPEAARRAGYTGWCRVRIRLSADGTVSSYEIGERRGHPLLGKGVESALSKIQGRNIGQVLPEPLDITLPIEFELN